MQRRHSQFGRRKSSASPRRFALRLAMHDFSRDFFQRLEVCPNNSPVPSQEPCKAGTLERASVESPSAPTEGTVLDAADLRSLRHIFLLLDEWDRAMASSSSSAQDSCAECKIGKYIFNCLPVLVWM
jgi:hypothetical protein